MQLSVAIVSSYIYLFAPSWQQKMPLQVVVPRFAEGTSQMSVIHLLPRKTISSDLGGSMGSEKWTTNPLVNHGQSVNHHLSISFQSKLQWGSLQSHSRPGNILDFRLSRQHGQERWRHLSTHGPHLGDSYGSHVPFVDDKK